MAYLLKWPWVGVFEPLATWLHVNLGPQNLVYTRILGQSQEWSLKIETPKILASPTGQKSARFLHRPQNNRGMRKNSSPRSRKSYHCQPLNCCAIGRNQYHISLMFFGSAKLGYFFGGHHGFQMHTLYIHK